MQPKNDHYITTAETAMFGMTVAGNSGTFLVDTIPMCRSLFLRISEGTINVQCRHSEVCSYLDAWSELPQVSKRLASGNYKYVRSTLPGRKESHGRCWSYSHRHFQNMDLLTASKAEGTAAPSFTASFLEELSYMTNKPADEEDVIRGTGSSAYAAGSDTVNRTPASSLV